MVGVPTRTAEPTRAAGSFETRRPGSFRNRVRACAAAGVAPEVRELERGTNVASWVMSVNVHRRQLDASQRALLASRLVGTSGEVTLGQAGELMGVSRASVARAAADAGQTSGEAGDGGVGVALGRLVDPEEPGPGAFGSQRRLLERTLFLGTEALERRDVVAPAHHEFLDLAASAGQAVRCR